MTKLKLVAAALVAAIAFAGVSTSAHATYVKAVPGAKFGAAGGPWPIFICVGGIITSALAANYAQNRELTTNEAWSCGFLYWLNNQKNPL